MRSDGTPGAPGGIADYREGLGAFLDGHPGLGRWRRAHHPTVEDKLTEHAALMRLLNEAGWNRYGWPESVGGLGGDERHRAVYFDELTARDLPVPEQHLMLETLGPAAVRFAPALATRFLPAYLRGDEWWGQGFSEPESGSDLASLRCRAERTGEHYVISGQKIWTSHGATAHRLFCLVRTGTAESRHRGLSMLAVDTDTPGVTVRPIALASGRRELAEIFFDGALVPASRLVGAEGQGWTVAMYLLQWERGMYAWLASTVLLQRLRALRDQIARPGRRPDGAVRRIGQIYLDVIALRCRSAQTVGRLAGGDTVGPEASADKVLLATAEQNLYDAARDLLSPQVEVGDGGDLEEWRADWWYSRAATIMGGSAEVQRGILADRVLGLPKEGRRP
jgi:alkylation response protein AidB-like acyl-CoA dehydrogenase